MQSPATAPSGASPRFGPEIFGLLALGAVLRFWQYAADASQWVDELALSRGILGLAWPGLGRLPYWQLAPRGFILLEKAGTALWGASDYGLRLLPLVSSLAALWLFVLLARRLLAHRAAVAFALALFALQPELIRYAAQVKPYAGDLAAALALTLWAADLESAGGRLPGRRTLLAGIAALAAVSLSYGAVLVLGGLSLALLAGNAMTGRRRRGHAQPGFAAGEPPGAVARIERPPDPPLPGNHRAAALPTTSGTARPSALLPSTGMAGPSDLSGVPAIAAPAVGLLVAGVAALAARRDQTPPMRAYLARFWAPSMGPAAHSLAADARWVVSALAGMLGQGGLGYPYVALYGALALLGAWTLWRRRRATALLLFMPTGLVLAAADLRLYPFAGRLALFVVPALILAIAAGVETLAARRFLPRAGREHSGGAEPAFTPLLNQALPSWRHDPALCAHPSRARFGGRLPPVRAVAIYALALLPALAGFAADLPVYRIEEMAPLLRAAAVRRQAGDAIYVYYGAGQALRFYGPRYGFQPRDYLLGDCHRGDTRAYLREIDRFRGRRRVWILMTHVFPRLGEDKALLSYLDHLGIRRFALRVRPHGRFGADALAVLYDLGEASRSSAAAATFPVPRLPHPIDPTAACASDVVATPANEAPPVP
jgi:hypothetical protein